MLPELEMLNDLRLENDLSYRTLAAVLARTVQVVIPPRTLHGLLMHPNGRRPHDRTRHKIKRFLLEVVRDPSRFGLRTRMLGTVAQVRERLEMRPGRRRQSTRR